jgi:hypothetical protein
VGVIAVQDLVRNGRRGRFLANAILGWALLASAPMLSSGLAAGDETAPLTLSAERVESWDEGAARWVHLQGRAVVAQGEVQASQGETILARIVAEGRGPGAKYRIDAVSAEAPSSVARLTTTGEVRLQAAGGSGVTRLSGQPAGVAPLVAALSGPLADPNVGRAQAPGDGAGFGPLPPLEMPAPDDPGPPPIGSTPDDDPSPDGPAFAPLPPRDQAPAPGAAPFSDLDQLPGEAEMMNPDDLAPSPELPGVPAVPGEGGGPVQGPILPGTRRFITVGPRDSGPNFSITSRPGSDGMTVVVVRGGVNITAEQPGQGIIDLSADNAVIFSGTSLVGGNDGGGRTSQAADAPLEVYLEGNVIFRQDERKVSGDGDQKIVQARQFYADLRREWFLANEAELELFNPQFMAPLKIKGKRIQQYRPMLAGPGGTLQPGPSQVRADETLLTASRFPVPGYRFQSRSVDVTQLYTPMLGPDGKPTGQPGAVDSAWRIDARGNVFKIGSIPVFYWPRIQTDSDDLDPPIRQIQFRANNYFGQQVLTDWNMFKILGLRRPKSIDVWNLDVDYLSYRGLAVGTDLGWSGRSFVADLTDPYRVRGPGASDRPYFGSFNIWGLNDAGVDFLGPGPAVVTDGPPSAGSRGFQRTANPFFVNPRGHVLMRHMQFLTNPNAANDEELRYQLEFGYNSDRNFLEQYYKRIFDVGLDQSTLAYMIYQRENTAVTILGSANLQDWYTDTQFFPKVDYYRLGDAPFGRFTYWQNSGVDYANTHTDVMVNDPNLFVFQPFDPVSATSGAFRTGRLWTSHELALPINLDFLRITPYVQGQAVGWDNQYQTAMPPIQDSATVLYTDYIRGPQGAMLGRLWGAAGGKFNVLAWKIFPDVESELLNLHGLAHKISADVDYRITYATDPLGRIGVQDQLDDNTYEFVRRYFALINYVGGILPAQYDPRYLTLRRGTSPITGTTDIQDTLQTAQLALRQRLQTKRGPEGRRRVVDWMIFDISSTYFPEAERDNFGVPWGLSQYNYEWFVGDRTSLVSTGWFEFWDVTGRTYQNTQQDRTNDPFGLRVITMGVSVARPPRSNIFVGYSVINTGVIDTSALNVSFSYWLSPKWYSSFGTSYDFGNRILLGSTVGITRVGADFLTSIGLTVDPQRNSYMFAFELTPRLSPAVRFGSGGGLARFDPRFAATQ